MKQIIEHLNIIKLNKLAGSLKKPQKFRDLSLDEIIEYAKQEYFSHHGCTS